MAWLSPTGEQGQALRLTDVGTGVVVRGVEPGGVAALTNVRAGPAAGLGPAAASRGC